MNNVIKSFYAGYLSIFNTLLFLFARVFGLGGSFDGIKVVCVHRVGQIGDLFCALPALSLIKEQYPKSHLILLTSPGKNNNQSLVNFLNSLPYIDEVLTYANNSNELSKLYKNLQKKKIDLWISLPQDRTTFFRELRNIVFARLVGARSGIGFVINTAPWFEKLQAGAVIQLQESERLLAIVKDRNNSVRLEDHKEYENDLGISKIELDLNLPAASKVMVLAPGSNRDTNRWPIESFSEVAKRWISTGGAVILIGGAKDIELGSEISKKCDSSALFDMTGKLSISQTLEAMRLATIFVGNDSGPMHMAAAVGLHCVVAFSARDYPLKWYPMWADHSIVRKDVQCSPCLSESCQNENLCLKQISVDEIWNNVQKYTNQNNDT